MKAVLDTAPVAIPCARCGRKTKKTIGWIHSNSQFTCSCGAIVRFDASQLIREMRKVDRAVSDLKKTIEKSGK